MAISIHYIAFLPVRSEKEIDVITLQLHSSVSARGLPDVLPVTMNMRTEERPWLYSNVRWARGTCFFFFFNLTDNHLSWWTVRDLLCIPDSMQFFGLFIGFRMSPCFPPCVLLTGRETKQKATFHVCVIPKHNYWYFSQKNTHSHSFFVRLQCLEIHTYI